MLDRNEVSTGEDRQRARDEGYVVVPNPSLEEAMRREEQQQAGEETPAEAASIGATTITVETDIETDIETDPETETESATTGEHAEATTETATTTPRTSTPLAQNRRNATPTTSNRRATPTRVTYEELSRRPRSNPRSRTPMRYESPLNQDEFRRGGGGGGNSSPSPERMSSPVGTGRITIRPLAGRMVGTTLPQRTQEERRYTSARDVTPKSRKQGPSHRKVRRWNNENFINLASEFEKSSTTRRGKAVADTLRKAHAEAHLHRDVYDPNDNPRSELITRFMKGQDKEMLDIREKFFNGELPATRTKKNVVVVAKEEEDVDVSADVLLKRVDGRLRRVMEKSCTNSYPATKVVDIFEKFLVRCFVGKKKTMTTNMEDLFKDMLLELPTVSSSHKSKNKDSSATAMTTIQMFFDGETHSETGGFHRLLCHGVCQFHGLKAESSSIEMCVGGETRMARVLTVKGTSLLGPDHRILGYLVKDS